MDVALICELFEELPTFRCIKVETVPAGPKYSRIQFFKRVLVAKGIFRTPVVREPILRLDEVQERIVAGLVGRVLELERGLG